MRIPSILALLFLLIPRGPTAAQSPFNAALLVPRRDSFTVSTSGRTIGYSIETLRATDQGFELTSQTTIGRMTQHTRVTFTNSLEMLRIEQEGNAGGQATSIDVIYAHGRAKGRAVVPGPSGLKDITVDTTVPGDAVDDNALQALLPSLSLKEGVTHTVRVFASGQGELREATAKVGALEPITVAAGTFQAYPVALTGLSVPVVFHVSAEAPRRVLRVMPAGSPVVLELGK